jgi:4-carboxymuconolactone decarboxylase
VSGKQASRHERALARLEEVGNHPAGGAYDAIMGELADPVADFAFGDVHARGTLDARERELIIIAMLTALGGCEPQLASHLRAARAAGATEADLEETIFQALPYVGVPRTINAMQVLRHQQEKG